MRELARPRRRMFNRLATLSLVLCVATCVLWVRGRFVTGESAVLQYVTSTDSKPPWRSVLVQGWSSGGGLRVDVQVDRDNSSPRPRPSAVHDWPRWTPFGSSGWHFGYETYRPGRYPLIYPLEPFQRSGWRWSGFQWARRSSGSPGADWRQWSLTVPAWFLASTLAIVPAWAVVNAVRHRRYRKPEGLCPTCGYDLRAGHDKCPECGTPVQAKPRV